MCVRNYSVGIMLHVFFIAGAVLGNVISEHTGQSLSGADMCYFQSARLQTHFINHVRRVFIFI